MKLVDKLMAFKNRQTYSVGDNAFLGGFGLANSLRINRISSHIAWQYYKDISPIGRGVKLIAQEAQNIVPKVYDKKTDKSYTQRDNNVETARVLGLLENPNKEQTRNDFIDEGIKTSIICGEIFLEITGITKAMGLKFRNPKYMTPVGASEQPDRWKFVQANESWEYVREEDGSYLRTDGMARLYQFKKYNPDNQTANYRGLSDISQVIYEVEQHIETQIHNTSTLKRGARPSGALIMDKILKDDRKQFVKDQFERFYSGSGNAGNVMILDGSKEFKPLSLNSKDMDFVKLLTIAKDSMYENLNIPASFYDNSASSFNNKFTDRMSLYDFAVIPNTRWLYNHISKAIFSWNATNDRLVITFNEEEIPALKDRYIGQLKEKASLGAMTPNEVREELSLDPIDGGEELYQPMNLIPVGSQVNTGGTESKMAQFTNKLVEKGYPIDQIEKFVSKNKHYLT